MSDNELDNLFKEAAEGFTPPQDESAWKQMASLLDQHAVKTAGFWNWKTISAVTVTGVIAVTAVWFATTHNSETVSKESISKTLEKNESNNATQGVVQEQKEHPIAIGSHPAGKQNFTPEESLENKSSGTRAVKGTQPKRDNNQIRRTQSSGNGNEGIAATNNRVEKSSEGLEPVVPVSDKFTGQTIASLNSENSPSATPPGREHNTVAAVDSLKPLRYQDVLADSAENTTDGPDRKDNETKARGVISIKAVVSPDFSSANFFSAGKTGINYGLLAGYSFNNRWSVYTGVIFSKKLYDTKELEGTSYSWNGHNYPVKELDGDCRILDIPINVYYTFFPEHSFSLRAGLGFSSYIMRKETYVYCVDNYGADVYYAEQVTGKNNEWFKILNLSVAVSKKITNRWSAEFEPFVKAPLAGVGEGKVSLVSMGAFINLKFDLTHK